MLDEIALTDTVLFHIREQLLHTVQLMVSWPDLFHGFLLRVRIFINDDLSVILDNSGEFPLRQNVLPQIVCHDAVRVRRIARTIVIALVEWQKPAVFTSKLRAEHDGLIVGCAALYPYGGDQAELACVAVHPHFRRWGYGEQLLKRIEMRARAVGIKRLFVLTTMTSHWFRERGFVEQSVEELPEEKRLVYNLQRRSKVFSKSL